MHHFLIAFSFLFSSAFAQNVDSLIAEQKFDAALQQVKVQIDAAKRDKKEMEWAKLNSQEAMLEIALHGYETAVENLKARPWPTQTLPQALVGMVYAKSLQTYHQSYSWEIRKRERIESKEKADLKTLTSDQIYLEADRAFLSVWKNREALGRHPKNALGEVVGPNSFPTGIRDTLRDTLSYLFADLLADTAGWTPRQSNEAYLLDLKTLIAGSKLNDSQLADSTAHPLEKISAVLSDLERWHEASGRKGAALEARLERYRHLEIAFTDAASRAQLIASLKADLSDQKSISWVTTGYAALASLVQASDDRDARVKARAIAQQGAQLFPSSPGAARCRDLIHQIEQPTYSLEAMNVDGSGKRSIGLQYQNIKKMYFKSYRYDLKEFIRTQKDYSLRLGHQEIKPLMQMKPDHEWSVDLTETVDYRSHQAFVVPPRHKPGFFIVVSSMLPNFAETNNYLQGVQMFFGDLVLNVHPSNAKSEFEVEVASGKNGDALPGIEVSLYQANYQKGHQLIEKTKTDAKGFVTFKTRDSFNQNGGMFLIAERGDELIASRSPFQTYVQNRPGKVNQAFVYTDRSIYRPGQKILWKVVAYQGDSSLGQFAVSPSSAIQLDLRDSNYQVVATAKVTTNRFGSASGEFLIPPGKLLGNWTLSTPLGSQASIRIEEYKRPTFELKFAEVAQPMRLNREAKVEVNALYYFGLPLTTGAVKWTVTRQAVFPWWCFWGNGRGSFGNQAAQVIASGKSKVQADGKIVVPFVPKADEKLSKASVDDLQYRYIVSVDVTDEGGETRSLSQSYSVGFSAVTATVTMAEKFVVEGAKSKVTLRRTDLNGKPAVGKGSWKLVKLKEPQETLSPADQPPLPDAKKLAQLEFRTPDDGRIPRWRPNYQPTFVLRGWESGATLQQGQTDSVGTEAICEIVLSALNAGAYRFVYETKDSFGTRFETQKEFLVVAAQAVVKLPGYFEIDRDTAKVGEKIRLYAMSGFAKQRMILETYRAGELLRRQELISGNQSNLIEVPITEADRGGLGFTLRILHDHQEMRFSEAVLVPWDNKELKLEFSTFRDQLTPGGKEKWTLRVSGPGKKAVNLASAEILAYMYDRSLDSFGPHHPPQPLSIYPQRSESRFPQSELGEAPAAYLQSQGIHFPTEGQTFSTDEIRFYANYGVGGPGHRGGGMRGGYGTEVMSLGAAPMAKGAKGDMMADSANEMAEGAADERRQASNSKKESDSRADAPAQPTEVRTNFSETAFWKPQLLTDKDGSVAIEFTVPDSVTSWQVWAHAIAQDLSSGQIQRETKSVKDLMVRPYLPRFLREGDEAEIQVVINNASKSEMSGVLDFDILDAVTQKSILADFKLAHSVDRSFKVAGGKSATQTFKIKTPPRVGLIAIRTTAKAGKLSDGELRPIPILPGRFHLAQSRFVTLKDAGKRELRFDDLNRVDDPSRIHDQVVVTLDAQLFYSVLSALPYLVQYPYESIEQTLNSFVSTGILTSVFKKFPAVEKMAKEFSSRKTQFESWNTPDPNRKMALEETPWVVESQGGDAQEKDLMRVLDPKIAKALQSKSLETLEKSQTSMGGFPWFPGGPPSPGTTLYLLYGFSKALEFGVNVPKPMIQKAWAYLHQHYIDELVKQSIAHNCCYETITFLNYVLSNYPDVTWSNGVFTDAERKTMLNFSFKHWKEHSPYLKGYLALTLNRAIRAADAKLVWDSVMDSAKTSEDEGTHWAAEDRSWLWYQDTIETHAFALRTGSELGTSAKSLDGMVQWLFLNKKLNHWKSTRATAEVIYSLTHYLQKTAQLGVKEKATVKIAGEAQEFQFDPEKYTGKKNQILIPADKVGTRLNPITVEKSTPGHLFASATWNYSTEKLPTESRGDFLKVERAFFKRTQSTSGAKLQPLAEGASLQVGDEVEVHLSLTSKHPLEYVHLNDPRGAGFEPVEGVSKHKWDLGIYWYEAIRDSGTHFFFERLPQGEYRFKYRIRATTAGAYKASPATVQPMYAPEFNAFSAGSMLKIEKAK